MKPENRAIDGSDGSELTSAESASNKAVKSSEDEKAILNLLKEKSPTDLNALKEQTGLSNKKWDKAIKGLAKSKLEKVEKTEVGLFVSVV